MTDKKLTEIAQRRLNARSITEHGKNLLILERLRENLACVPCAFCGEKHIHGTADGHRLAHCGTTEYRNIIGDMSVFENGKGERFSVEDGYYVQTFGKK